METPAERKKRLMEERVANLKSKDKERARKGRIIGKLGKEREVESKNARNSRKESFAKATVDMQYRNEEIQELRRTGRRLSTFEEDLDIWDEGDDVMSYTENELANLMPIKAAPKLLSNTSSDAPLMSSNCPQHVRTSRMCTGLKTMMREAGCASDRQQGPKE